MPSKKKTWNEKAAGAKTEHVAVLDKPFAGLAAGARLLIPSPRLLDSYFRSVPAGRTVTLAAMRGDLAKRHDANATCPMTTGIFARIAAEAALEDLSAGRPASEISPFWRVIAPKDPVAAKLSCGLEFIETQRKLEQAGTSN